MKAFFLTLLFTIAIQFFVVVPITFAVDAPSLTQLSQCSGPDCSACNVVYLANGMINWLIGMAFLLFAVLFCIAGVRLVMSGGNHHTVEEAKGSFVNAIVGLIIILSAWLIVDTIMRGLVGTSGHEGEISTTGSVSGWLYWSEVQCQVQTKPAAFKAWQSQMYTYLQGVSGSTWTTGSDGIPVSSCAIVGYFGTTPTYDCSAQLTQCKGSGPALSTVVNNGSAVSCQPSGDVAINMGGGNSANCPPAPESSMVTVPGSSEKARPDIAQKFVSMRAAAAADGVNLIINEGWRDDATQLRYWNNNHCDSGCSSPVARPCSKGGPGSNHEQGEAFDIKLSQDPNALKWLQSNASRFGFYNHLPTDLVHWSVTGY